MDLEVQVGYGSELCDGWITIKTNGPSIALQCQGQPGHEFASGNWNHWHRISHDPPAIIYWNVNTHE